MTWVASFFRPFIYLFWVKGSAVPFRVFIKLRKWLRGTKSDRLHADSWPGNINFFGNVVADRE